MDKRCGRCRECTTLPDILDDPVVVGAIDKLATIMDHRDHTIDTSGWDWFMPGATRVFDHLPIAERVRLALLCLVESPGYTWHNESLYLEIIRRLPGYGDIWDDPPPAWWQW